MAQLKITIEQMRLYVRSLDERLADTVKYPDTWCDSRVNTGYEITATTRQPFLNEEILDLNPYITDGTTKFEVDMDGDVQGYKRIYAELGGAVRDKYTANIPQTAVRWEVNPNQTIAVTLSVSSFDTTVSNNLTFQYYYFPTVPESETYMSADVYHMLRHAIEVSTFETIRDYEKMNLSQQKLDQSARTAVNGLDIDVYASEGWDGGFMS